MAHPAADGQASGRHANIRIASARFAEQQAEVVGRRRREDARIEVDAVAAVRVPDLSAREEVLRRAGRGRIRRIEISPEADGKRVVCQRIQFVACLDRQQRLAIQRRAERAAEDAVRGNRHRAQRSVGSVARRIRPRLHVPDARILAPDFRGVVFGHLDRVAFLVEHDAPVDRRDVAVRRVRRHLHPPRTFTFRVPRVQFERQDVALGVREPHVAAVGLALVVEAGDRRRVHAHEHGEVGERRRARIARIGDVHMAGRPCRVLARIPGPQRERRDGVFLARRPVEVVVFAVNDGLDVMRTRCGRRVPRAERLPVRAVGGVDEVIVAVVRPLARFALQRHIGRQHRRTRRLAQLPAVDRQRHVGECRRRHRHRHRHILHRTIGPRAALRTEFRRQGDGKGVGADRRRRNGIHSRVAERNRVRRGGDILRFNPIDPVRLLGNQFVERMFGTVVLERIRRLRRIRHIAEKANIDDTGTARAAGALITAATAAGTRASLTGRWCDWRGIGTAATIAADATAARAACTGTRTAATTSGIIDVRARNIAQTTITTGPACARRRNAATRAAGTAAAGTRLIKGPRAVAALKAVPAPDRCRLGGRATRLRPHCRNRTCAVTRTAAAGTTWTAVRPDAAATTAIGIEIGHTSTVHCNERGITITAEVARIGRARRTTHAARADGNRIRAACQRDIIGVDQAARAAATGATLRCRSITGPRAAAAATDKEDARKRRPLQREQRDAGGIGECIKLRAVGQDLGRTHRIADYDNATAARAAQTIVATAAAAAARTSRIQPSLPRLGLCAAITIRIRRIGATGRNRACRAAAAATGRIHNDFAGDVAFKSHAASSARAAVWRSSADAARAAAAAADVVAIPLPAIIAQSGRSLLGHTGKARRIGAGRSAGPAPGATSATGAVAVPARPVAAAAAAQRQRHFGCRRQVADGRVAAVLARTRRSEGRVIRRIGGDIAMRPGKTARANGNDIGLTSYENRIRHDTAATTAAAAVAAARTAAADHEHLEAVGDDVVAGGDRKRLGGGCIGENMNDVVRVDAAVDTADDITARGAAGVQGGGRIDDGEVGVDSKCRGHRYGCSEPLRAFSHPRAHPAVAPFTHASPCLSFV